MFVGAKVFKQCSFVLTLWYSSHIHITFCLSSANNFAQAQKRKTLLAADVLEALEDMEFGEFLQPLKEQLEGISFIFCIYSRMIQSTLSKRTLSKPDTSLNRTANLVHSLPNCTCISVTKLSLKRTPLFRESWLYTISWFYIVFPYLHQWHQFELWPVFLLYGSYKPIILEVLVPPPSPPKPKQSAPDIFQSLPLLFHSLHLLQ